MDLTRKVAMAIATLAVAFAAGQYVQGGFGWQQQASLPPEPRPTAVVPLAAGNDRAIVLPDAPATPALPDRAMLPPVAPDSPAAPTLPDEPALAQLTPPEAAECSASLDLAVQPDAMLGLTLLAPCHPSERVVLRHGGLAVTGKTSLTGSLFLTLPALEPEGHVSVLFADGSRAEAETAVPAVANVRRFGVQWMADDSFQLHAFENGADYGMPGHVSAADPHRPTAGVPSRGGFLSLLGDASVDLPMLAEVYTFPTGTPNVRLVIESAVTEATCDRELLGETLASAAGTVAVTELTVAMPGCDAVGDYLVLKNLLPDPNIAAAN
jgi:hypothetical protein